MKRHTSAVRAEVTVHHYGQIYIGVEVAEPLDIGYNDRVRVTVPRDGQPDFTYSGCLNRAYTFPTGGKRTYRELHPLRKRNSDHSSSFHVDAIVEPLARTWDNENGMTERRSDNCYTLDAKL